MEALLRLKHWHIFMLTFGFRLVAVAVRLAIDLFYLQDYGIKVDRMLLMNVTLTIDAAGSVIFVCWAWVAGISLADKRPYDEFNANAFKAALAFQVFNSIVTLLMYFFAQYYIAGFTQTMRLVSLGAFLYSNYVVVRRLTSVELDRDTSFGQVFGDFLLLVFYPIGIWWLQPRINRVFDIDGNIVDPYAPLDQGINIES